MANVLDSENLMSVTEARTRLNHLPYYLDFVCVL